MTDLTLSGDMALRSRSVMRRGKNKIGESLKIIDPENYVAGNQESLSVPQGGECSCWTIWLLTGYLSAYKFAMKAPEASSTPGGM